MLHRLRFRNFFFKFSSACQQKIRTRHTRLKVASHSDNTLIRYQCSFLLEWIISIPILVHLDRSPRRFIKILSWQSKPRIFRLIAQISRPISLKQSSIGAKRAPKHITRFQHPLSALKSFLSWFILNRPVRFMLSCDSQPRD